MKGRIETTLVDAVRIAAYTVGRPERGEVVVVPGLCASAYLRPAADALAALGFRVHLVDPRGWPHSDPLPGQPESVAEVAAWVSRWLVASELRDVVLIGQSMGAQLAAHVAGQCPEQVGLLILQGPTFDPAYRTVPRALWRLLCDLPRERPSFVALEAPEWLRVGLRQVLGMARIGLRDRLEMTVNQVRARVVVIVGEHETLATLPWTRTLGRGEDECPVVMPGLPHCAPYSDPAGFARLVVELSRR